MSSSWLGGLIPNLGAQPSRINPEKYQIRLSAIDRVCGKVRLLRPRQMDESILGERRRSVLANPSRFAPFIRPRDMNDHAVQQNYIPPS